MRYQKNIIGSILTLALLLASTAMLSSAAFAVESDAPPSLELDLPPSLDAPSASENDDEIEITNAQADPDSFNPLQAYTEIKYEISKDAIIEIKILKPNNDTVITLVDDEQEDAGENTVKWYGRENNQENGDSVPAGNYKFKIIAKNTTTEATEDTAEGAIEIIATVDRPDQPGNGGTTDGNQNQATMTLQNSASGHTAGTGPGVLIYFLFPLGGYLITKRKK